MDPIEEVESLALVLFPVGARIQVNSNGEEVYPLFLNVEDINVAQRLEVNNNRTDPPVNGARNALNFHWLHHHYGHVLITPDEFRRYRSFLRGYNQAAYGNAVLNGISSMFPPADDLPQEYEIFMTCYRQRQHSRLSFEIPDTELVSHMKTVVFYRDLPTDQINEIPFIPPNVEPDEFEVSWYARTFGEVPAVEKNRLLYAEQIGFRAASYAGALRGMEIGRLCILGQPLLGADQEYFGIWSQQRREDIRAGSVNEEDESVTTKCIDDRWEYEHQQLALAFGYDDTPMDDGIFGQNIDLWTGRRPDIEFLAREWFRSNRSFNHGWFPLRTVSVVLEGLCSINPENWNKLLKNDFKGINLHQVNEMFWPDWRNNENFQLWYESRPHRFRPLSKYIIYLKTSTWLKKYFTDPKLKKVTAAIMVKLLEIIHPQRNVRETLGEYVMTLAEPVLTGDRLDVWERFLYVDRTTYDILTTIVQTYT